MRDFPWEDIFKLGASVAGSEFCEWAQVGIDVYTPHRKYHVKPHSSPWFSATCATAIVHRNHFFRLYQKEKSSDSKVKFRQASNDKSIESPYLQYWHVNYIDGQCRKSFQLIILSGSKILLNLVKIL